MRLLLLTLAALIVALPAAAQYEVSLVADIRPGADSSFPFNYDGPDTRAFPSQRYPVEYDGRLFFAATNGESWEQLWAYDATTDEVELIAEFDSVPGSCPAPYPPPPYDPYTPDCNYPHDLVVYDGRLFFSRPNGPTGELWAYDAAADEVSLVANIDAEHSIVYDERLFFQGYDQEHGAELWVYDANTNEASLFAEFRSGDRSSWPSIFTLYDGRLVFYAAMENGNGGLWAYDAATDEIVLFSTHSTFQPIVYDDRLFFGEETLYAYDGESVEAVSGSFERIVLLTTYDGRLFFRGHTIEHGGALWAYDATTNEVERVLYVGYPSFPAVYDGQLFLEVLDGGTSLSEGELWAYDATTDTATLFDFYSGSDCLDLWPPTCVTPGYLTVYDDRLFFRGHSAEYGAELWAVSRSPIANEPSATPQPAQLRAPHPNPAQDRATVTFDVAESGPVHVEVFDVLGRSVALLTDGPVAAGEHALTWETDARPSGLYLVRLTAGDTMRTQRLTLAR